MNVPVKRVTAVGVTDDRLNEYGITRDEAKFMRAVVMAVNGELEGYDLTQSMAATIKSLYDINEQKLRNAGLVRKHVGTNRRVYYSVTRNGQEACRLQQKHGPRVGDLGDHTPHRVGVELARRYYDSRDDVQYVQTYTRSNGGVIDAVAMGRGTETIAAIEVEAGRTSADPDATGNGVGINDYDSIRKDYEQLMEAGGEAVWVTRNHEIAGTVLRALTSGSSIQVNPSVETIRGVESGRIPMHILQKDHIDAMSAPGLNRIITFGQIRNQL
ncbi:hypothetical protein [Natronosalvus amylolyticus]|uniref:hypothetical protein n=1 Tax=Natronosalvus amylolyticus TaxID=2961994 RepID=UPI0020CA1375|nr:hypothetical protein [Natronosalvus amylolyticus]